MLLYEADNLMLFQGTIESPDIPTVNYHISAGKGETLPLRSRFFWFRVLTPFLADTSNEGAFPVFSVFSTIAILPRLASKRLFLEGGIASLSSSRLRHQQSLSSTRMRCQRFSTSRGGNLNIPNTWRNHQKVRSRRGDRPNRSWT